MCLFLMCSCDNHDFELSEKEQVFYINQMLHFSIEPWDSLSKAYTYDFFLRNPKPCKEVDTIYLERKIPNKFEVIETSSYTREYNRDPSFIKLLPNTQYIVAHTGMGGTVNIFKYYYTDPFGKLHANDSLNEHINVDSIRIRCGQQPSASSPVTLRFICTFFGENSQNPKKTFSNTVPTAPMPSIRSISAARRSHSTICIQLRLVG